MYRLKFITWGSVMKVEVHRYDVNWNRLTTLFFPGFAAADDTGVYATGYCKAGDNIAYVSSSLGVYPPDGINPTSQSIGVWLNLRDTPTGTQHPTTMTTTLRVSDT